MSVRNLDRLFHPASVVLIGTTAQPGSIAAVVAGNLARASFSGKRMIVDPDVKSGPIPAYRDIAGLPGPADLAILATPLESVPALISELGKQGTKAAVVLCAEPSTTLRNNHALARSILEAARPYLLRVVGPESIGLLVPRIGLDASCSHLFPEPGTIAFLSQSGSMVSVMLDWAVPRRIGFSHIVSLGEASDVDLADALDYLATEGESRAILVYIETLGRGRKFMSAARAAARSKPVLILKAGRRSAGADRARSSCGVLAGGDLVYDAAFRRAGALRVDTMAELFDAAESLAATREQIGERVTILTNSGGAGLLASDALFSAGVRIADLSDQTITAMRRISPTSWDKGEPIDLGIAASGECYSAALAILIQDRELDAILVLNSPTALVDPQECARAVAAAVAAAPHEALRGRNIFAAWLGEYSARAGRELLAQRGIANYETPDGAVAGFMHRVRHHRHRELLMETPPAGEQAFVADVDAAREVIAAALASGSSWLDPEAARGVLAAYGIPFVPWRRAADPEDAAKAAGELGFPVALEMRSTDPVPATNPGDVALNLADADAVRRTATAMRARFAVTCPEAQFGGFLLRPMPRRPPAVALQVGLVEDPVFGPIIVFGQSGRIGETAGDCSLELPPLNRLLARRLIARTRAIRLLQGHRDPQAADLDALIDLVIRVGQMAIDLPELREVELDPVLADSGGVVSLAAQLRVSPVAAGTRARLAIAPYPQELVSTAQLRDGTTIVIRPVRPEDEPLLHGLAAHMSREDLRLRFFTPVQGLTHVAAARLSQLDYDRELALIAIKDLVPLGVVHYFADPDNAGAEYAIAVRSDWKGHGLGYLLMNRLIEIARQRGIGELVGEVLRENEPMLQMCRELGFKISAHPSDSSILIARKPLLGGG